MTSPSAQTPDGALPPGPPPIRVAPFDRARTLETAAVLARAFAADPVGSALVPPDRPVERLTRLFRADIERALAGPHAIDLALDAGTGRILGATIWEGPGGRALDGLLGSLRAIPYALRGAGPLFGRLVRSEVAGSRARPTEAHWYLAAIGADPAAARRGVGRALLTHRLGAIDRAGLPAYLESSKPANDPYYERYGFAGIGTLDDGELPPMTRMWREPA